MLDDNFCRSEWRSFLSSKSIPSELLLNFIAFHNGIYLSDFLTSSSTTMLYRGRVPSLASDNLYVLPHTRQSGETMASVSSCHIILTQPVGSERPQRGSNPGPPDQESSALPTELLRPPIIES